MIREEFRNLFNEENPSAVLGKATTDEEIEYAVIKILTSNFDPFTKDDALHYYLQVFGEEKTRQLKDELGYWEEGGEE